jgi:hypothetical protein
VMLAFYSYVTAQFEGLNGSPIAHTVAPIGRRLGRGDGLALSR